MRLSGRRIKRTLGFVAGALFGVILVATCGGGGGHGFFAGGDGGGTPSDSDGPLGVRDAHAAGPAMMAACDKVHTFTYTDPNNTTNVSNTSYFAEISVPGLDPTMAPHISIIVCQNQCSGSGCPYKDNCPMGYTCNAGGYTHLTLGCQTGYGRLDSGKIVVDCGYHNVYKYPNQPQSNQDVANYYQVAYVRVD